MPGKIADWKAVGGYSAPSQFCLGEKAKSYFGRIKIISNPLDL
jgi:hypothetical protein